MTTAERRRRRRRGGGLRVPSDNVPRTRSPTTPPVTAPVPEDPALAMSIAYSFTNDASGPVPRTIANDSSGPIAPEAASTEIDDPSQDFEMKTREMNAVDLQALGLEDPGAGSTLRMDRVSSPQIETSAVEVRFKKDSAPPPSKPVEDDVDVMLDSGPHEVVTAKRPVLEDRRPSQARLATVALSEEDLEEVRAATQPGSQQPQQAPPHRNRPPTPNVKPASVPPPMRAGASQPPPVGRTTTTPPAAPPPGAVGSPPAAVSAKADSNRTQPLSSAEVEVITKTNNDVPMSVPEIDINELAERAGDSGEIEVDVEAEAPPPPVRPARAQTAPPIDPAKADRNERKSGSIPVDGSHAPPPPPPAAHAHVHTAPPAPPKKPPPAAVAAVITKEPSRPSSKGKPWFVDLFDEDYLRTLPFLTPQATQAEAEFVIDAMALQPAAQVLDVGCGYGRHAMELAARGFHVVGLDLSTPLLVRGGEESHRRGLTINFVRGDMRELDFENQFDAAYCLFSTFGYFDDETNKKTLINIARALKTGGKVLVEILNRDYVIADLPTRVWWEGDGCVVLEEVELNYFSSRIQVNRSVVFDDGRQLEQEISVRAYSLHEVGKLMHAAGFRVLEVSGGYQTRSRFFGNQSRHIIVLAERKEPSGA